MRTFLPVLVCCATAAYAEDFDRMAFSTKSGRLVGQMAACDGHERLSIFEGKIRTKAWYGAPPLQISPIVQAFLKAKLLGQEDQNSENTGMTRDQVKVAFTALAMELQDVSSE